MTWTVKMRSRPTKDLAVGSRVAWLVAISARLAEEKLVSTAVMRMQDVQRRRAGGPIPRYGSPF